MIARILALFVLVGVISGGAWYVLRPRTESKIVEMRDRASYFLDELDDLDSAAEWNAKILQIFPGSVQDLVFRAEIFQRKGTMEGYREALDIYDKLLLASNPNTLYVAILKARVCRTLGLTSEAQAALLSVVDVFPFEATMQLGETALSVIAAQDALRYYTKARELATRPLDAALAEEGIANSYLLFLLLNSAPRSELASPELEDAAGGEASRIASLSRIQGSCRKALDAAISFVKEGDPASPEEASRWLLWATGLGEKRAEVKIPGTTPCFDTIVLVEGKMAERIDGRSGRYATLLEKHPRLSAAVRVRLGALRLRAAREEGGEPAVKSRGGPAGLSKEAEMDFIRALGASREDARKLLAQEVAAPVEGTGGAEKIERGAPKLAVEYLTNLATIVRIYLGSEQFTKILEDSSELALAARVSDGVASSISPAKLLFLMTGLARLRKGEASEGKRIIDAYIEELPKETKPRGLLSVAEEIARLLPNDPVVFQQLDAFEKSGGKPLDFLGKKITLLTSLRARKPLEVEASRRIDDLLARAAESMSSAAEQVGFAKILYSVKGCDPAMAVVRQTRMRYPDEPGLRRLLGDLLFEKGSSAAARGDKAGSTAAHGEALGEYLALVIRAPLESQEALRRAVEILRKLEEDRTDPELAARLKPLFSSAPAPVIDTFASSLRAFLLGQFGPALDRANAITEPDHMKPFLSFLKGTCHVGLSVYLQRDAAQAVSDVARQSLTTQYREHVKKAMEEFSTEAEFPASRFELADLEFQGLPPRSDVDEDLLKRIQRLSETESIEHNGHFLLARALQRRFDVRYADKSVKNSELVRILTRVQKTLRSTIRAKPTFIPAYLALAETFLVSERKGFGDALREEEGRQIFKTDHEKAINVLKTVPNPDEKVMSQLAQYLEIVGKKDEAARYLERLALMRPTAEVFFRLVSNYLDRKDNSVKYLLDEDIPQPDEKLKEKHSVLLDLRKHFEVMPDHVGLRHMLSGVVLGRDESQSTNETIRKQLREKMIVEYDLALEAYQSRKLRVPSVLLNNLAWYLAESDDGSRRARAVDLAKRGLGLDVETPGGAAAPLDPRQMPDLHDTYAWALHKNGQHLEAEKHLRDLIKAVDRPVYRYHLAQVLLELKKFDEALVEVQTARDSPAPFPEDAGARRLEEKIRSAREKAIGK